MPHALAQVLSNITFKNKMKQKTLLISMLVGFASGAANAQVTQLDYNADALNLFGTSQPDAREGGIQITDTVKAYPSLQIGYGHDSNTGRNPEVPNPPLNQRKRSDTFTYTELGVDVEYRPALGGSDAHVVELGLRGNDVRYTSNGFDNVSNSSAALQYEGAFGPRFDLALGVSYLDGEDPRGSVNDNRTVNAYDLLAYTASWGYGAREAAGRMEVDLGTSQKRYDAGLNITLLAQNLDTTFITPRFIYRPGSATQVFAEYKASRNEYVDTQRIGVANLNSTDGRVAVGIQWDATAKTAGRASVGYKKRDFEQSNLLTGTGSARSAFWDIGATWKPTLFDNVQLSTKSDILDDFINTAGRETRTYGLAWAHRWSDRITTTTSYQLRDEDFRGYLVGGMLVPRADTNDTYVVSADYKFRNWLTFGAEYSYETNDSSLRGLTAADNFNYSRDTLQFLAKFSM